jgi:uncharacterized membrane protein
VAIQFIKNLSKINWSKTFLKYGFTTAFCIGLCYALIIPPFHTPDEFSHFYRSYQIADGHFVGEFDSSKTHVGGYIPKSLKHIGEPFDKMCFDTKAKTSFSAITKNLSYPLNRQDTEFVTFINTARYFPLAYSPQSATIFILKQLDCPPLIMFYIGRLICLILGLFFINIAVKITPVYKELLMILAFLPSNLSICASFNADTLTNGILFIILAYFLKFKTQETQISSRQIALISILLFLSTLNKICYFPIIVLYFLIPARRYGSIKIKLSFLISALAVCFLLLFLWNNKIRTLTYPDPNNINTTTLDMRVGITVNPDLQIRTMMAQPVEFLSEWTVKSLQSYQQNWQSYLRNYGWDGGGHPAGLWILFTCLFFLVLGNWTNHFSKLEKFCFILVGHSMTMLFLLVQHLQWDAVGNSMIIAYLGKYWVPIYPILLLVLIGWSMKLKLLSKYKNQIEWLFTLVYLVGQIDNLIIAYARYYIS